MNDRPAKDEITAAVAGGVVIGVGWLTSGAPGHPALLFVCGFPVGMVFGVRMLMLYDDAGKWGRSVTVTMGTAIAVGIALLTVRRVTGWW